MLFDHEHPLPPPPIPRPNSKNIPLQQTLPTVPKMLRRFKQENKDTMPEKPKAFTIADLIVKEPIPFFEPKIPQITEKDLEQFLADINKSDFI